jgi:hypothetical protein
MRELALATAALGLMTACGGSTLTTTCSGTVTGALMGTFSVCNDFDQLYRANLDTYSFTGDYVELPTSFTWTTDWEVEGEPKAMATFDEKTPQIKCNVTMKKSNKIWVARIGAGVAAAGTCALAFTDVTANMPDGNVTTYKVKGKVTAHLEADPTSGSTGTVDVTMDFCNGDSTMCQSPTK